VYLLLQEVIKVVLSELLLQHNFTNYFGCFHHVVLLMLMLCFGFQGLQHENIVQLYECQVSVHSLCEI